MLYVRTDILKLLSAGGYSSYRLRKENLISQSTMSRLRHGGDINLSTINTIVELIPIDIEDLLVYKKEDKDNG